MKPQQDEHRQTNSNKKKSTEHVFLVCSPLKVQRKKKRGRCYDMSKKKAANLHGDLNSLEFLFRVCGTLLEESPLTANVFFFFVCVCEGGSAAVDLFLLSFTLLRSLSFSFPFCLTHEACSH
jgi:hypothetical protein